MTLQLLTGSESSPPSRNGEVKDDGSDDVERSQNTSRAETKTTENKREMKEDEVSEPPVEITKEAMDRTTESSMNVQQTVAAEPENAAAEMSPEENSADSENPDKSESDLTVHDEPVGEGNEASSTSFTPPANPPPDPPPISEPVEDSVTR